MDNKDQRQDQDQYSRSSSSSCSENSSCGQYFVSADEVRAIQEELEACHQSPYSLNQSLQYDGRKEPFGNVHMIEYCRVNQQLNKPEVLEAKPLISLEAREQSDDSKSLQDFLAQEKRLIVKKRPIYSKKKNNQVPENLHTARLDEMNHKYEKMRMTAHKLRQTNIELRRN